jgi:hypothetical protein
MAAWPCCAASCSGVSPLCAKGGRQPGSMARGAAQRSCAVAAARGRRTLVLAFTLAPRCSSGPTTLTWLYRAAECSGSQPPPSCVATAARSAETCGTVARGAKRSEAPASTAAVRARRRRRRASRPVRRARAAATEHTTLKGAHPSVAARVRARLQRRQRFGSHVALHPGDDALAWSSHHGVPGATAEDGEQRVNNAPSAYGGALCVAAQRLMQLAVLLRLSHRGCGEEEEGALLSRRALSRRRRRCRTRRQR